MVKKFVFGIFCGIIATLFVIQSDPWVHYQIGTLIKAIYAKAFRCTVTGHVQSINFFNPHIVLTDLSLTSPKDGHGAWSWKAKRYTTGFSWSFFFKNRAIDMWIVAENLTASTDVHEGMPSIAPHVKALMSVPDLPIKIFLKSTQIRNAFLTLTNGETHGTFSWNSETIRTPQQVRSHFFIKDGSFSHNQAEYIRALGGTVVITIREKNKVKETSMNVDCRVNLPHLGEYATCFIAGAWQNNRARFNVHSIDKTLRINPLIITEKDNKLHFTTSASFPIAYFYNVLTNSTSSPVQGECILNAQGTLDAQGSCEGYFACEDIRHSWFSEHSIATCSFQRKQSKTQGTINIRLGTQSSWRGTLLWKDKKEKGTCFLYNNSPITTTYYPNWCLQPTSATIDMQYDRAKNSLDAHYTALAENAITNNTFELSGKISNNAQQQLCSTGTLGTQRYELITTLQAPYLSHAALYTADNKTLFDITYDEKQKNHHSSITMPFFQSIASHFLQHEIHGEGTVHITSSIQENTLHAKVHLSDATIRLPQTYNFVNGFDASIIADIPTKQITLQNVRCTLHSGSLQSPRATIWLNETGSLQFAHIPLLIDHCLFTVKQDLFTMVSGYLLFTKQPQYDTQLTGHIMLDRSQLKENLFSEQEQKKLLQSANSFRNTPNIPLQCNISLETKDPIRVDTKFLQANAEVDLHVYDTITAPQVSGSVTVPSGTIKFPYKPLHITKGEVTFLKDQLFNPIIELVAKNNIKNHHIALHVAGSIQNHAIVLEATPPLTEEQIVNLLLTGAHEESLNAVIPALLMQNVSDFIFSSHKSDFFDRYIKPFMKQINVQLKPEFNDQTGRGGLRGALEITVSDRWRALIEKNFSLTEDTRFELEYTLSDDVTFRVIRDERRDVGGEVEMTWKF